MKRIILVLFLLFSSCFAQDNLLERFKTNRDVIYQNLNLSQEQIEQIKAIDEKMYEKLTPELDNVSKCSEKIKDLISNDDFTLDDIDAIKQEFDETDKKITLIKNDYEKEFNDVLTLSQKAKYKSQKMKLRKKLKKEMKELKKNQNAIAD